jgi:hypothetical protein
MVRERNPAPMTAHEKNMPATEAELDSAQSAEAAMNTPLSNADLSRLLTMWTQIESSGKLIST